MMSSIKNKDKKKSSKNNKKKIVFIKQLNTELTAVELKLKPRTLIFPAKVYDSIQVPEAGKKKKKKLLNLLSESLALNIYEKLRVIKRCPFLTKFQVIELISCFKEENMMWRKKVYEHFKQDAINGFPKNNVLKCLENKTRESDKEWQELSYRLQHEQFKVIKSDKVNKPVLFEILSQYYSEQSNNSTLIHICKSCGNALGLPEIFRDEFDIPCPNCDSILIPYDLKKNEFLSKEDTTSNIVAFNKDPHKRS